MYCWNCEPPTSYQSFNLHIFLAKSISREEIVLSMEKVFVALRHMQQENQFLHESITHSYGNQTLIMFGSIPKKPQISLPKKFDDTCSKFQSFINQIHFIIQLHQHRYPNDQTQVGLIGTLLSGTTLTWFTPLLECQSPFLNNFEAFLKNFGASFDDSNKEHTTLLEICHFVTILCNWFSVATDTCNWKLAQLPKTSCKKIAVASNSLYMTTVRLGYTVSSTHILH